MVSYLAAESRLWPTLINCYVNRANGFKASTQLQSFYLYQSAWYWHLLLCHYIVEASRRDHLAVLLHHVVAVTIMTFSFMGNHLETGIVVFLTHQPTMTVLEFGKAMHYIKLAWIEYALFPFFIVSWFVSIHQIAHHIASPHPLPLLLPPP